MTVLSITSTQLKDRALERGAVFLRHGASHDVYKGELGTFTIPKGSRKPITGRIVSTAARALGTTTKELLGT